MGSLWSVQIRIVVKQVRAKWDLGAFMVALTRILPDMAQRLRE